MNHFNLELLTSTEGLSITFRCMSEDYHLTIHPSTTIEDLIQWLNDPLDNPSTGTSKPKRPYWAQMIFYDHESGKLFLDNPIGADSFDPMSEEQVSRLIRKLKTVARRPQCETLTLPLPLPIPTEDQLARRIIYSNPAYPSDYPFSKRKGRKSALSTGPTLDSNESSKAVSEALQSLILSTLDS